MSGLSNFSDPLVNSPERTQKRLRSAIQERFSSTSRNESCTMPCGGGVFPFFSLIQMGRNTLLGRPGVRL
jgi:hypothetical protein